MIDKEGFMNLLKLTVFSLFFCFILGCDSKNIAKSHNGELLSEQEAMNIVANFIRNSEYLSDYYLKDSDKYDSRVEELSWGEPILIDVIADGVKYQKNTKYYLLTGVLPNGQVLIAQTINAYTGALMDGAIFVDENSDKLVIAKKSACLNYAASRNLSATDICPVFYCDGSIQTQNTIFSWKYLLVNEENSRAISEGLAGENNYIDPWVNMSKNTLELRNDNAFFSRVNYNHRLYKLIKDSDTRKLEENEREIFIPLD